MSRVNSSAFVQSLTVPAVQHFAPQSRTSCVRPSCRCMIITPSGRPSSSRLHTEQQMRTLHLRPGTAIWILDAVPPFERPMSWLPPTAPWASLWAFTNEASMTYASKLAPVHSHSVSPMMARNMFYHIFLSRHLQKRRLTLLQLP